jgi:hypothetical protein
VAEKDAGVVFAPEGSRLLAWVRDPASLRKEFKADARSVTHEVIREQREPVSTLKLKAELVRLGLDRTAIDAAWPRVRAALVADPTIRMVGQKYEWQPAEPVDQLAKLSPVEALTRLADREGLPAAVRQALAKVIQSALEKKPPPPPRAVEVQPPQPIAAEPRVAEPVDVELAQLRAEKARLEAMLRDTHHQQVSFRAAQDRQLKIDSIRTLAEMAIEVEELAANGAEPEVIIERVRALAEINELEPIGQVGETTTYDPTQHRPLAGQPDTGSAVAVVRPGYTWHAEDDDVLLEKAIVG